MFFHEKLLSDVIMTNANYVYNIFPTVFSKCHWVIMHYTVSYIHDCVCFLFKETMSLQILFSHRDLKPENLLLDDRSNIKVKKNVL